MPGNLTRREFLKDLGLLSAGVTLAPVAAHGEAIESFIERADDSWKPGPSERPSWVKTVDKPTVEIDWEKTQRFDGRKAMPAGFNLYVTDDRAKKLAQLRTDNLAQWMKENKPGYALRDQAIANSITSYEISQALFIGPQKAQTPEQLGVPRWKGTPEDASAMLTVALRFMGAASVGFVELDPKTTQKLIYSYERGDGKRYDFADVDQPSEDKDKRVIPNRARWAIVYTIQMSRENFARAPTPLGNMTASMGYDLKWGVQRRAQEFMRGLGYMCLGEANTSTNALGIAPGLAVMAGIGELSRLNRVVTPEYGPMVRVFKMITDLPLAPTKPIDTGIMQFCGLCKKCAEACPSKALSFDPEPTWQVKGEWNNPGHKAFFEDSVKCYSYWQEVGSGCSICFASCPFATKDKALYHQLRNAITAGFPAWGGVAKSLDDMFYGTPDASGKPRKDPNSWWTLDQPEYGFDTSRAKRDSG